MAKRMKYFGLCLCGRTPLLTRVKYAPGSLWDVSTMQMAFSNGEQVPVEPDPSSAAPPAPFPATRLAREWKTLQAMLECYCRAHHPGAACLCADCQGLLDYAALRLARCRFGPAKPTCVKCPVHCYQRERREQVRAVMRYAGPRMLWRHPVLSLRHWLDSLQPFTVPGVRPSPGAAGEE